jgi:hypothetical protein
MATRIPNVEINIGIILTFDRTGSCLNFITHKGGIIKAIGHATTTPWKIKTNY